MMTSIRKPVLAVLAVIYLLGCQSTVIRLASSLYSISADTVASRTYAGPAKPLPHVSWTQHRTHLPLLEPFTLILPHAGSTVERSNCSLWVCRPGNNAVILLPEPFALVASDLSPPLTIA